VASIRNSTPEATSNGVTSLLRAHKVHLFIVALFALYPGIHAVLTTSPVGREMTVLLPPIYAMIIVLYFGLFAMSFDFISGYTGYLSFGHAAFYGVGAYTVVLIANDKIPLLPPDTPYMFSLIVAGLFAAIVALAIGTVSFQRTTGVYFAMVTLGFAEISHVFIRNWRYVGSSPQDGISVIGMTEGFAIGVPYVSSLQLQIGQLAGDSIENLLGLGIDLSTVTVSYYMIGLVVLVSYLLMKRILNSPYGRVMVAIRGNENRAKALGYNTFRYKLGAFVISGFFAGVAGALLAGYHRSADPEIFFLLVTAFALVATIVGGTKTLAGALYGYLFYITLEEMFKLEEGGIIPYLEEIVGDAAMNTELVGQWALDDILMAFVAGRAELYIGIIFVFFVLYLPRGILGMIHIRLGSTVESFVSSKMSETAESRTGETADD